MEKENPQMLTEQMIVEDANLVEKIKDAAAAPSTSPMTADEFLEWLKI